MIVTARTVSTYRALVAAALLTALVTTGCAPGDRVQVKNNGNGTITVSILPGPNSKPPPTSGTTTTTPPPGPGTPPSGTSPSGPVATNTTPPKPGNGGTGSGTTEPIVPQGAPPPAPPSTSVPNPTQPTTTGNVSTRQQLEQKYGITVNGKDANNETYLKNMDFALGLYPPGSMKGLQVTIDIQDLNTTNGVGGFWTASGNKPRLTVYQASVQYLHISVHELAHHHDLWVNRGNLTPTLYTAAKVNGQVPAENIPSPYGRYGLQNQNSGKLPEYGAEVTSWSLDRRGAPGFSTLQTWKPQRTLITALEKFVEREKIVWNKP